MLLGGTSEFGMPCSKGKFFARYHNMLNDNARVKSLLSAKVWHCQIVNSLLGIVLVPSPLFLPDGRVAIIEKVL